MGPCVCVCVEKKVGKIEGGGGGGGGGGEKKDPSVESNCEIQNQAAKKQVAS